MICGIMILAILISSFLVAGCSNKFEEDKLAELIAEFDSKGFTLHDSPNQNGYKLNGKKPYQFLYKNGELWVYIFDSGKEVEKALREYEKRKEIYNVVIPQIFTYDSVLIFYFGNGPRTDHYSNRDKDILEIVNTLKSKSSGSVKSPS